MKRVSALLAAAGLALLPSACATPVLEYEGTSSTEGVTHKFQVSLHHGNGIIRDTYTVGVAAGTLSGSINDTLILATLTPVQTATTHSRAT